MVSAKPKRHLATCAQAQKKCKITKQLQAQNRQNLQPLLVFVLKIAKLLKTRFSSGCGMGPGLAFRHVASRHMATRHMARATRRVSPRMTSRHLASRHMASSQSAYWQGQTWRQVMASCEVAWARGLAPNRSGI